MRASRPGLVILVLIVCGMWAVNIGAQTQRSDDQVWSAFLGYLKSAPPLNGPLHALQGFDTSVRAGDVTDEEATRQAGVVRRLMSSRGDWWPLMFDRIYASDRPTFSQNPSTVLVEAIEGVTPGRALDVAMGQGRNALFLAQRGWTVTGFDISGEGLNVARANAGRAGVALSAQQSTIDDFEYGDAQWDLIALIYVPHGAHEGFRDGQARACAQTRWTARDRKLRLRSRVGAAEAGGHRPASAASSPESAEWAGRRRQ